MRLEHCFRLVRIRITPTEIETPSQWLMLCMLLDTADAFRGAGVAHLTDARFRDPGNLVSVGWLDHLPNVRQSLAAPA